MKKYATYKQSGIEWAGDIPENWSINRIKNIASLRDKKELEYKDNEFLVALENIEGWTGRYIDTQSVFDIGGIRFKKGDVLFGKLRPYLAKVYLSEEKGVCVSEILAINTDQRVLSKFLFYRLLSSDFISIVNSSTYGAKMPRANWQFISNLTISYPKNIEQTFIANYLDERTAKLDKLIKNKEDQIEKLKEIRQIEINTAVTKGLNPKAKMKNSGIDWLGDIPAEWEVERIKNVCEVNPKKCDSGFSSDSTMPVVFLPMESVSESGEFDDSVRIPINELWPGFTYFKRGDIVLAKITPCFENGKCACLGHLSTEIGFGTTEFHVLRPSSKRVFNRFIYYITKSEMFMQFGKALMTGAAGQKRVPTEFIQTFKIAVPGIKEQIQITDYLDERMSIIDRLILNFVCEIEKLKEIRKIEIYNAVTGKIKVV